MLKQLFTSLSTAQITQIEEKLFLKKLVISNAFYQCFLLNQNYIMVMGRDRGRVGFRKVKHEYPSLHLYPHHQKKVRDSTPTTKTWIRITSFWKLYPHHQTCISITFLNIHHRNVDHHHQSCISITKT